MASRAETAVDVLTDDSDTLAKMVEASVEVLDRKPEARQSLLAAVRKRRGAIVSFVQHDTKLTKEITGELVKEMVEDKPVLDRILRELDIVEGP